MTEEGSEFWTCKNEQQFKMAYIKGRLRKPSNKAQSIFCIETEETVQGFPDVMEVISAGVGNHAYFYEFKFSDKTGKIKFQPTQPAFYRNNSNLNVTVIAFNQKTGTVHKFSTSELFEPRGRYALNIKAEVNLCRAEK